MEKFEESDHEGDKYAKGEQNGYGIPNHFIQRW